MAKEGGGCHPPPPPPPGRFFQFFLGNGKSFTANLIFSFRLNFEAFAHEKNSDLICRVGPKIRQREGAGGNHPPPPPIEQKLTYFSHHEDDIQF